jgi:predicted Zn-dependent protease
MYVLYVKDSATVPRAAGTGTVAGVAFRADSFVVFSHFLYSDTMERTVLVQEAGHLLGLEHDDDASCAMIGTLVENLSMKIGLAQPPDDYCPDDRKQLDEMRHWLI